MPPRRKFEADFDYGEKYNGKNFKCRCLACLKAEEGRLRTEDRYKHLKDPGFSLRSPKELRIAAKGVVDWISSREPDKLHKHLSQCQNVATSTWPKYSRTPAVGAAYTTSAPLAPVYPTTPRVVNPVSWDWHMTNMVNCDTLRLFASLNLPFRAAEDPMFQYFMKKYAGSPPIAPAVTLRQKYLKEVVLETEAKALEQMRGKLGMGQCDGWTNIAKTPLVAILVKVEGQTHVRSLHDVSVERKTAENLLNLVLAAILELQNADVEVIGWVSDAGGDSRAMRLKLSELMPHLIVLDCWAHQINLIVGDYFKLKGVYTNTIEDAICIVRWFNGHSLALGFLREVQKALYGKTRALIEPFFVRWTSHYHSVNRLCDLEKSLLECWKTHKLDLEKAGGGKPEQKEATEKVSKLIANPEFWHNLRSVRNHLHPLTVASNMTQGSRGALYSVALTLANLYRIYSSDEDLDIEVKKCLLESIEKRWAKTDQDSFLAAVILNPYIRQRLFKKGSLYSAISSVYSLFKRLWTRFFGSKPDAQFLSAVRNYCQSKGSFSAKEMFLEEQIDHLQGMNLDILQVWTFLDDGTFAGENQVVALAVRVHSAVANSADCERLFSQMGAIHTKARSRLDPQVVRDLTVVKMALREEFKQSASIKRKRKREEFEALDTAPTPTVPAAPTARPDESEGQDIGEAEEGEEAPRSTQDLVTALTTAANGDDTADDTTSFDISLLDASLIGKISAIGPRPTVPSPSPSRASRPFFGAQQVSSIEKLFDFGKNMEMWNEIGRYGEVRYLEEERELENRSRGSTVEIEDEIEGAEEGAEAIKIEELDWEVAEAIKIEELE